MLDLLFIAAAHAAEPLPVVTLGGGAAAGPSAPAPPLAPSPESGTAPPSPVVGPNPGGWIPVLADCLEERAAGRFTVVDRSSLGNTMDQIRGHLAEIRALSPAWVVVALGPAELEQKGLRTALEGFVGELGAGPTQPAEGGAPRPGTRNIVLLGLVPPPIDGTEPQAALDERAARWNKLLGEVASRGTGVVHVDLWSTWPKEPAARAALSTRSGALSEQGLARVAAAVCDVVLAKP